MQRALTVLYSSTAKKKHPKKGCFEPERAVPSSLGEPRVFQPRAVSPRWLQLESGVAGSVLRLPQPLTPKLSGFPPGPTLLCALPVGSPPKVVRTLRVQAFLVSLGPRKGTCAGSFFCFRCFPPVSALSVRSTSLRRGSKYSSGGAKKCRFHANLSMHHVHAPLNTLVEP